MYTENFAIQHLVHCNTLLSSKSVQTATMSSASKSFGGPSTRSQKTTLSESGTKYEGAIHNALKNASLAKEKQGGIQLTDPKFLALLVKIPSILRIDADEDTGTVKTIHFLKGSFAKDQNIPDKELKALKSYFAAKTPPNNAPKITSLDNEVTKVLGLKTGFLKDILETSTKSVDDEGRNVTTDGHKILTKVPIGIVVTVENGEFTWFDEDHVNFYVQRRTGTPGETIVSVQEDEIAALMQAAAKIS